MIEIRMIKDIGSYENKVLGPLTLRQLIAVSIAAPIGWGIYRTLSPYLTTDLAGFLLMIPAGCAYLFGWYKPYGMTFEKFLKSVFVNTVLAPSHRKYKTENRQESAIQYLSELTDLVEQCSIELENCDKVLPQKHIKQKYKTSHKAVM